MYPVSAQVMVAAPWRVDQLELIDCPQFCGVPPQPTLTRQRLFCVL